MPSSSQLGALKTAVRTGLAALSAFDGVEVWSAEIFDQVSTPDYVCLGGPDDTNIEWHNLGKTLYPRAESSTLRGYVSVRRGGAGEEAIQATRDRAFVLEGAIEAFILADPSVGGVAYSAICSPVGLTEGVNANGERVAVVEFEIRTGKSRLAAS